MTERDPLIGSDLGDYRPIRILGRGGMGAVYEAEDLALGRRVALKVLLPEFAEDTRARTRFQKEIDYAVAIEHPHVVPVYSAGFDRPHFFIAMRLVPGPDVSRVLSASGPLEESRALRILGQVASALHAVHASGLVHRDVKPHNVLLWQADGDEEHAMLTDFGIAKALDDTRSLTGVSAIGTPAYMAPEVCVGQLASAASDQYSLACMAYELLSGEPPFSEAVAGLRQAHAEQNPRPLNDAAPGVSPAVAAAIDRGLSKTPERRHADIRAFVRAAKGADIAFRQSQQITAVLAKADRPEDAVEQLSNAHGLSDAAISQLTDIDRTQVVALRRRQARSALVGRRRS